VKPEPGVEVEFPSKAHVSRFGPDRDMLPSVGASCPDEPVPVMRFDRGGMTWLPGSPSASTSFWRRLLSDIAGYEINRFADKKDGFPSP